MVASGLTALLAMPPQEVNQLPLDGEDA